MISQEEVAQIKKDYPVGTRIRLIKMEDPYTQLGPGDEGIVDHIDDAGTIHMAWDSGSTLGLIVGEDEFQVL